MKKLLLNSTIAAALLLVCPSVNAQQAQSGNLINRTMLLSPRNCVNLKAPRVTKMYGALTTRMPQEVTEYSYNKTDEIWDLKKIKEFTYDQYGMALSELEKRARYDGTFSYTRTSYEYDENGMMTSSLREVSKDEMATWNNNKLNTFEYDNIVTDALIMQGVFKWDATNEVWNQMMMDPKNVYREILRDENGRVTQDQWWDSKDKNKSTIGYYLDYGEGENLSKMYLKDTDVNNNLYVLYIYDNIEWYKTNNQHVRLSQNVFHVFGEEQQNLVKSYKIYATPEDGMIPEEIASYTAEYDDKDRKTSVKIAMNTGEAFEGIYKYDTEGEGSYVSVERNWMDTSNDGILDANENVMFDCKVTMKYDEFGNKILDDRYDANLEGNYEHTGGYMSEYKYAEDGAMLERIDKRYNKTDDVWELDAKYVYESFTDVETAISETQQNDIRAYASGSMVMAENADGAGFVVVASDGSQVMKGKVSYSRINLGSLPHGMYIVKIADIATVKVVI